MSAVYVYWFDQGRRYGRADAAAEVLNVDLATEQTGRIFGEDDPDEVMVRAFNDGYSAGWWEG